jgi:hypothetical protein
LTYLYLYQPPAKSILTYLSLYLGRYRILLLYLYTCPRILLPSTLLDTVVRKYSISLYLASYIVYRQDISCSCSLYTLYLQYNTVFYLLVVGPSFCLILLVTVLVYRHCLYIDIIPCYNTLSTEESYTILYKQQYCKRLTDLIILSIGVENIYKEYKRNSSLLPEEVLTFLFILFFKYSII